jgi:hypothetical protein
VRSSSVACGGISTQRVTAPGESARAPRHIRRLNRYTKEPYQDVICAMHESICGQQGVWGRPKHRTKECGRRVTVHAHASCVALVSPCHAGGSRLGSTDGRDAPRACTPWKPQRRPAEQLTLRHHHAWRLCLAGVLRGQACWVAAWRCPAGAVRGQTPPTHPGSSALLVNQS